MPIVRTDRLVLRPVARSDAGATAQLVTDEVAAQLSTWRSPMSPAEARERIDRAAAAAKAREAVNFAICRASDDRLLGWIGLSTVEPGRARLGYWLGVPFHGLGYMSEAAPAALGAGAEFLGAAVVEASVHPDNAASLRILEKLGMKRIGEGSVYLENRAAPAVLAHYELRLHPVRNLC